MTYAYDPQTRVVWRVTGSALTDEAIATIEVEHDAGHEIGERIARLLNKEEKSQ